MTANKKGSVWLMQEIKRLEEKEARQKTLLKHYCNEMLHSLKPMSLVKSAVSGITTSPNLRQNIIDTSIGIVAGLITRRWYVGRSANIFKKLAGFILQNITTGIVAQQMPAVREKISSIHTK